jgi:hypothetical protein
MRRGTEASDWTAAAMTAKGVQDQVTNPPPGVIANASPVRSLIAGEALGKFFWGATLFCGFLVLCTSQTTTMDGFTRRWVDVCWTASPQLRRLDVGSIKYVYFTVLVALATLGIIILWVTEKPGFVAKVATTGYNFALAFSAWHTLAINTILLPRKLRPNWFNRIGLVLAGVFFVLLGIMSSIQLYENVRLEKLQKAAKEAQTSVTTKAPRLSETTSWRDASAGVEPALPHGTYASSWSRSGGDTRPLGGNEAARLVRPVAERFRVRLAAAAQRDGRLPLGDLKLVAVRIDDRDGTLNQQLPVVADFDGDWGHNELRLKEPRMTRRARICISRIREFRVIRG